MLTAERVFGPDWEGSAIAGTGEVFAAALSAAGDTFVGDDVLLGEVLGSRLHFAGGTPPQDKRVWEVIGDAMSDRRWVEATLDDDGRLIAVPLLLGDEVTGILLVTRSGRDYTSADRTIVAMLAGRLATALENRRLYERLDSLFRRYLPDDVANALIADPNQAELGGGVREITVLFADLRGFTSYSERFPPDEVVEMLNRYFGIAVPLVIQHGGTVTSFIGDAMMALFNAPVSQVDHVLLAATAGLAVQSAVEEEAARHSGWPRFRVGISSGPALVGNIGSPQRRTYTAIGDTVNVAARLEGLAEAGEVVIGGACKAALGGRAMTRPLGHVQVKGRGEAIEAFVLEGLRATDFKGTQSISLADLAAGVKKIR